jgi:hypothetical protein
MHNTIPGPADIQQLAAALRYASAGWPVFPCEPEAKTPATSHGFKDATTDPAAIRAWWRGTPYNVAIATGAPGPDVLDVDVKPGGSGFPAFRRLKAAGLLAGAAAYVQTRNDGLHVYFRGTCQGSHTWPALHIDLRAAGGYVLAPPSVVPPDPEFPAASGCYRLIESRAASGTVDWSAIRHHLEPPKPARAKASKPSANGLKPLAEWFAQFTEEGTGRSSRLWWCALKAAELVGDGKADAESAEEALMAAAGANGYIDAHGAREAQRTIRNGLRRGM